MPPPKQTGRADERRLRGCTSLRDQQSVPTEASLSQTAQGLQGPSLPGTKPDGTAYSSETEECCNVSGDDAKGLGCAADEFGKSRTKVLELETGLERAALASGS